MHENLQITSPKAVFLCLHKRIEFNSTLSFRFAVQTSAHSQKVGCLDIGETGRVLVTGGHDRLVNLFAIGNDKPIQVSEDPVGVKCEMMMKKSSTSVGRFALFRH